MVALPKPRLLAFIALLVAVFGCLIWFGTLGPSPGAGSPPGNDDVVHAIEDYRGDRVLVNGPVVDVDPLTIRVVAQTGDALDFYVRDLDREIDDGDVLSVYGTLRSGTAIETIDAVHKRGGNYTRTRLLSLLAGLVVLVQGVRYWQPSVREFVIRRRSKPLEEECDDA